ncbi:aldehyde dehydrogenase family protein [Terriglobus sp.]|uniref:aldehyde dehydrogenase family protein n=1 Tax=Terriglobus sp. TaxID=1889013 RepID=UPI003B00EB33
MAEVQSNWAALPVQSRLKVLAAARSLLAERAQDLLTEDGGLSARLPLEALSSEVLPLLAAMRFLEASAGKVLRPRKLGRSGLPLWMSGLHSEVHRVALGKVLVIGPSNYPLFLPGVQVVQALAAGNAVIWKPGLGGGKIANTFAEIMRSAGLPDGLLSVTDESVPAAERSIADGVDKVFLTGSAASGRALLRQLAERLIPAVVELSGCDAVVVLPGADLHRVVQALSFGMRLNGSCTCMAPRRLFYVGATPEQKRHLAEALLAAFRTIAPVTLTGATRQRLAALLKDAQAEGACIHGGLADEGVMPILVEDGSARMAVAQEDIFAPVITMIEAADIDAVLAAQELCPFGLTASLFGNEDECRTLAGRLDVGSVFINDLIFPSADPRVPFSGRRLSGFGVTQGIEGLLEMTAVKTISVQRSSKLSHYGQPKPAQVGLLLAVIQSMYARTLRSRLGGMVQTIREGRQLRRSDSA